MKSRYVVHTVNPGDTIQAIGYMYGVDWTALAVINGLSYPYIDSVINSTAYENTDEVAKIGDRLVIPTKGLQIPFKTNNSGDEIEEYTFGSDLDLFSTTMLNNGVTNLESLGELTADNLTGDVQLAKGLNNLRQQIIIRLGTPKGSLMMHPEWGCDLLKYIGGRTTIETLKKIMLEAKECVLGDFRVIGVSDMRASFRYSKNVNRTEGLTNGVTKGVFLDFVVHPIEPYTVFRIGKTFTK